MHEALTLRKETIHAGFVHDLRNPIFALMGCLDLLSLILPTDDNGKEILTTATNCGETLLCLIENFLSFVKSGLERIELFEKQESLHEVFLKVISMFQQKA